MKKLMQVGLGAAMSFSMVACNAIDGTVTVRDSLSLVNKKGQTVIAEAGAHEAELTIAKGGRELKLTLKGVAGKKQKIDIKLPDGQSVPLSAGSFTIIGAQVGQPVDIRGSLDTQITESPRVREFQYCTITEYIERCEMVPPPGNNGTVRRDQFVRVCKRIAFEHPGGREVISHTVYTDTGAHAEFLNPATGESLALFRGARGHSDHITDYYGACLRRL